MDQVVTQLLRSPLLAGRREPLDILNGAIDASVTSLTCTDQNALLRGGSYVEIDYEVLYVRSRSGATVTAIRGELGTTAATHSNGAKIRIEPRFPKQAILEALKAEIDDLPRDLFQITTADVTWPANTSMVNVPSPLSDPVRLLRVTRLDSDTTTPRYVPARLLSRQSTGDVASGFGVHLRDGLVFESDQAVRVTYGRKFATGTFTSATDLQSTVGLTDPLVEAVKAGAVWRLLQSTEVERTQVTAVGPSVDREQVPPTHRIQLEQGLLRTRDLLVEREIRRIHDEFGVVTV